MTSDDIAELSGANFRLDGQVALVTGAGKGLGAGAAVALAEAGAEVILLSRTRSDLEQVAARIDGLGGRARISIADVTDDRQIGAAFDDVDRLDILVNNAGTNFPGPFLEVTAEALDAMLGLNLRAAIRVDQLAVAKMLEDPDRLARGAAIIHMSSQMGHVGAENRTIYCATKHGLEGLTKALAIELASTGIRVNSIGPTFIETPLARPMLADPAFQQSVIDRIPLGRLGKIQEIAGAVVFLASPAASLITGTSLLVDGGWTAR